MLNMMRTEISTLKDTTKCLKEFCENIPIFMDLAFLFQQCIGEKSVLESEFHTFAFIQYMHFPYSAKTVCENTSLFERIVNSQSKFHSGCGGRT